MRRLAVVTLLATGCATLQAEHHTLSVTSSQPGTMVLVDGRRVAETPTTLVLRVDVPVEVRVVAPDGRTFACDTALHVNHGLVILQSLLVPLWLGLAVDAWTGAWNERETACQAPW